MTDTDASGCPSEEVLLRYSTDDLPVALLREVASHVERCAACAQHLRDVDAVFAAYRRHAEVSERASFGPVWHAEPTRPHTLGNVAREFAHVGRAGQVAAALCVVAGIVFWAGTGEVALSADALIDKAVLNEPQQSGADVPVAIAVRSASASALYAPTPRPEPVAELARRLSPHAFDTSTPLSARHFRNWRSSLALPREDVLEWETASRVRLSTTTEGGVVRRAELTLEAPDFRTVRQLWRFADGWEVELTIPPPGASGLVATMTDGAPPVTPPAANPAVASRPLSLPEIELRARAALHRRDLWPGRHLILQRHQRSISIEGHVADPDVVRQLTRDAALLERVTIRVRVTDAAVDLTTVPPLSAGLREWLDATFAPDTARVAFVPRLQQLTRELAEAAEALRELASRYPDEAVRTLPAPSRVALGRLADAYYLRTTQRFEALEAHLAPITGTLARRLFPDRAPRDWQARTLALSSATAQLTAEVDAMLQPSLSRAADVEALARTQLRESMASVASSTLR